MSKGTTSQDRTSRTAQKTFNRSSRYGSESISLCSTRENASCSEWSYIDVSWKLMGIVSYSAPT